MTKKEVELAPLRSLDDFLLGSARFQLPTFRDFDRWGNRVMQNLLYYQTNYLIMAICMILVFTLMHPLRMILGAFSVTIMVLVCYYFFKSTSGAVEFRKQNPLIGILFLSVGACIVLYLLGSFMVFLCGMLCPIVAIFIHSSLRLRNLRNKLSNFERVVSKTPLEALLEAFSMELQPDFLS